MKLLTRIRLVNWHLFENTTINCQGTTYFIGINGAGKSTILDAVQFALVGGQRDVRFNQAAVSGSKRTLASYVRGELGTEGQRFLRGDATGVVALEFNNPDGTYFVHGAQIDSFEDGATASFAGQHETYLNIVGADAIVQAVVRCWESARSEHALDYRRQQGLSVERPQIAVFVQQLVAADVAAVVFSANPITGSLEEVMINASWGLGESIVGGTVTPDTFIVRKSDCSIVQRVIADKQRMTISVPGGTREVDVPRFMRTTASLDDGQVIEMVKLALTLEATMERPVDVECAYAGGELYLLQCRLITTLE